MTSISASDTSKSGLPVRRFLNRNFRVLLALSVFLVLATLNAALNPRFFEPSVTTSTSNQAMTLIFAGTAQASVVITGGIDLSVGPMISLANSLASAFFADSVPSVIGVVILVLLVGALCGLVNGLIVVYGRLQPIIVTLATSSIFSGIALFLRPKPGGFVTGWYGDLLTKRIFDLIPNFLIFLLIILIFVWTPFRRSRLGLWVYAAGGNEGAAYMSGIDVNPAKPSAYVLSGFFAAISGLL